jgi:predicted type IV restriction endonuclease
MEIATKENFRKELERLVEQFSNNEDYYTSKEYKEDHVREEFINPFFRALGWDMNNEQGFAPQYREVIHEDRIRIKGKPQAPDYAFKVGSDRKFFVEAKASSVKVESESEPAFQVRRYAWSGRLPVSILTDFQEFSVYDTTIQPKQSDKASVARITYLKYEDYLEEVDYLWGTFSKEAVWKGSFDKFARREKKGSQLVDDSFLKEIEKWRELIAKDIASNNELDIYELNYVVQKFIDRIIFLRIAEDRGIETYETLKNTIDSDDSYGELLKTFKKAESKYNSSLFDFDDDQLSEEIKISDNTLDRILGNLYYPKSPYEFSIIGVDILGSVYEQFLGKVIRLTRGGNAVIEEKPEVKKAGGVYYTPQYIVDYIVQNTVGELLKDKTPRQARRLKIVDPACGSGSFLIGAYDYLLGWYLKYYESNDPEKHVRTKRLFKDSEGNYLLSAQEKKEILTNNVHGVDIDPQAVEVTKLSLALKMLEGENSETIGAQFVMFADRILPDLSSNIKCGNSLIGSDYYSGKQVSLLSEEEIRKVNAFDWDKEFPKVFRYGGFDAVIGNPPYIRNTSLLDLQKEYFQEKYSSATGQYDIYILFNELAKRLLQENGKLGFIQPNKFLSADYGQELLIILKNNFHLESIWDVSLDNVFKKASVYPYVFIFTKIKEEDTELKKGNLHMFDLGSKECFKGFDKQYEMYKFIKEMNGGVDNLSDHIEYVRRGVPNSKLKTLEEGSIKAYKSKDIAEPYIPSKPSSNITYKDSEYGKKKEREFNDEMIMLPRTVLEIRGALKGKGIHVLDRIYYLKLLEEDFSLNFLLGLINSSFFTRIYDFYFFSTKVAGGYYDLKGSQISSIPVPSNPSGEEVSKLEELVEEILKLKRELMTESYSYTKSIQMKEIINNYEEEVNSLVKEMYLEWK